MGSVNFARASGFGRPSPKTAEKHSQNGSTGQGKRLFANDSLLLYNCQASLRLARTTVVRSFTRRVTP